MNITRAPGLRGTRGQLVAQDSGMVVDMAKPEAGLDLQAIGAVTSELRFSKLRGILALLVTVRIWREQDESDRSRRGA